MNNLDNLDRIEIILCDTQDGANIGSVCRAMKTMGLTHLTLVTDRLYDEERVRTLALHAYDLYENRKEFTTLEEAISDSILSVAATRRVGKGRKTSRVSPEELANHINSLGNGKVSVVFGCESNGLSDQQVKACSMVVTIPTSDKFPSLNLSQAVQIICYSLFQNLRPYAGQSNVVDTQRINQATQTCLDNLDQLGYFKNQDEKDYTTEFLTSVMQRAGLTEGEVQRFEKLFIKTNKIALHKN
ncbi:MAG: RNA methyltransferase [Sphaerochaetaceae bacterium]|nr:RNA methyltransferase [Sphaerochaetaceae bacterium]